MKHSRQRTAAIRQAVLAAAFVSCFGAPVPAQDGERESCAAKIRAVLADIAARDLDTSQGPPLNAFLVLNPNAVAQAEALDRQAAAGEAPGALFCVPVAVKDNFDTYDMPTAVGSLALIGNQPPRDAPFVARLRAAGAIIVGKTNMDEFAMGIRLDRTDPSRKEPDRKDIWAPADADTQKVFAQAIALLRDAGAEIVADVALDDFNARLGPAFLKGFARKVDAIFATFPGARRSWADVCTSERIRPEWSAKDCLEVGATSTQEERQAVEQVASNQRSTVAVLDRLRLDALLYPVDGRGGARAEESPDITCFVAGASGLPAAAFPVGLDARGLPVGLELLGRPQADETLVAMMAAFETVRGPLPRDKPLPAGAGLANSDIPRLNELHLQLGWRAFRSRRGTDLGALTPLRFRTLTEQIVKSALKDHRAD